MPRTQFQAISIRKLLVCIILLCPGHITAAHSASGGHDSISQGNGGAVYTKRYSLSSKQRTRETILYLPGQGDAISMYRYLAKSFNKYLQLDATLYDLRGQGRSPGARCHIGDYQEHLNDFRAVLHKLEASYDKIHVTAHSTGALIAALHILSNDPGKIASLTMIAPFFAVSGPQSIRRAIQRLSEWVSGPLKKGHLRVFPFNPTAHLATAHHNITTTDPNAFEIFNLHPDKCGVPTYGWLDASFRAQENLIKMAKPSKVPSLMLTAGHDRVISSPLAKQICQDWNERKIIACKYHEYPDKRHGLVYETPETRHDMLKRIKQHIAASAKSIFKPTPS